MGKVKNQHYVPQSYLKYFTNDKDQVFVYDKDTDKEYIQNMRNIASERYFYDFSLDDLPLEAKKEIEENMMDIIGEQDGISIEDIYELLNNQPIEKFFSNFIENHFKKLLDKIRTRFVMSKDLTNAIAITKEEILDLSYLLSLQIARTKEFRESYFEGEQKIMQAMVDTLAMGFEENDNPIVKRGHKIHPIMSMEGWGSEGIEICMPINISFIRKKLPLGV